MRSAGFLMLMSVLVTEAAAAQSDASGPWRQYANVAEAGYSAARLDAARRYADSVRSGAVIVIYRGNVLAAWGDVSRPLELHSVRKSIVSALFGIAAADRKIDTSLTLADLGIDDREPLTSREKSARIADLLAARSGVYLPAAYAASDQDSTRPGRGSHAPGTNFFYNNWDFNVLGVIHERLTGADLYESFRRRLAEPLGMEDYAPGDGFRVYEPSRSIHPAHTLRLSARDLARFGQLYLQNGRWNGRQLIPAEWIATSTTTRSEFGAGRGYAWLWWTYAKGYLGPRYPVLNQLSMYAGTGTGGQHVLVIPETEMVIVHRGDTDHGREIAGRDVWRIAEMVVSAKDGSPASRPSLTALKAEVFASQAPPLPRPNYIPVEPGLMSEYSGDYELAPNVVASVFVFEGRLFGRFPQGEAELFAVSRNEFTIRASPGVVIRFERDAAGRVSGVSGSIGPQQFRATRRR